VLAVIGDAAAWARTRPVDIHVMTFSFTDDTIAALLAEVARAQPNATVRIIADWNQGSEGAGRQVRSLARLGLANLTVRYKNDQPYAWDPDTGRIRWSYGASHGLLHHKTLAVFVDRRPHALVCGSFNWTGRAAASYENLLVLTGGDPSSDAVMSAMEREFEALWSDGRGRQSPAEVSFRYPGIVEELPPDPGRQPGDTTGLGPGEDVPPAVMDTSAEPGAGHAVIAFSSRSPHERQAGAGYCETNRSRRLDLHKPSGKVKSVPLNLTTLALDTIAQAQPGDRLLVAMYGLSSRVPEYGALLDAARRGVRLRVLLDGSVGRSMLVRLATVAHREQLPVRLRAGARTMHQKYVVHPETATVLTGTANMSTDASRRHTEHRIAWRGDRRVAAAFQADFEAIWARIPPPFTSRVAPFDT
jgi:phosphatidylserine/phosphatidylglycerophosphate/cardiolipin synthase-like enzyme